LNIKEDISYTSINILQRKFFDIRKNPLWVPDWGSPFTPDNSLKDYDALLMGRYFERIFQPEFWPEEEFNLFCLSPQIKKVLEEVFMLDANAVGNISRYEMFPKKIHNIEPFSITPETHFYHSGRISAQKNIEFLILTIFYLQIFYSTEIKLSLIGNFDNDYHRDLLGCQFLDYSIKINKLINSLPWPGNRPLIINDLDENTWINSIPTKGIFFSGSNLISEDFSVTSAQLQMIGRPMLLPYWAGLKDVCGINIRHYAVQQIGHSNEELKVVNLKARKFAQDLIGQENLITIPEIDNETFIPLKKISRSYLQEIINTNLNKWGPSIKYLVEKDLPTFAVSEGGQLVLSTCRKILS
jgi:hypothetical protein